jgi:SepF-like predicted cell division protein (DUF552 family)
MTLVKAFGLPMLSKTLQTLSLTSKRALSTCSALEVSVSPVILGLPSTKKKTKVDPIALRRKEEKRKLRLKKALKKMEKKERLPKPFSGDTVQPSQKMVKESEIRTREDLEPISEEIEDERIDIIKEYSRYCFRRNKKEIRQIDNAIILQKAALENLRQLDVNLYKLAIAPDDNLIPFKAKGPMNTPPIPGYLQDGEYENITRKFEVQYADMEQFLKDTILKKKVRKKKKDDDDE